MFASSSIKTSSKRLIFHRLSVNAITRSQSRLGAEVEPNLKTPLPRTRRPKSQTPKVRTLDEAAVESLYDRLLNAKKIRPIEPPTRPEQVKSTSHPKYYTYHRFLGHPTRKCKGLKSRLEG